MCYNMIQVYHIAENRNITYNSELKTTKDCFKVTLIILFNEIPQWKYLVAYIEGVENEVFDL